MGGEERPKEGPSGKQEAVEPPATRPVPLQARGLAAPSPLLRWKAPGAHRAPSTALSVSWAGRALTSLCMLAAGGCTRLRRRLCRERSRKPSFLLRAGMGDKVRATGAAGAHALADGVGSPCQEEKAILSLGNKT